METVRLEPPIRIGFPWELALTFPAGYLAVGDEVRASLRRNPADQTPAAECGFSRDGDVVTLSLAKADTAALQPQDLIMDLVLVTSSAEEHAITSPRFLVPVQHHATKAAA